MRKVNAPQTKDAGEKNERKKNYTLFSRSLQKNTSAHNGK